MNYKGHIIFGLCVSTYIDYKYQISTSTLHEQIPFYSTSIVASILPDIDTHKSMIGRMTFPVSFIINKLFGHRGITHSFLFTFVLYLIIKHFIDSYDVEIGFVIGYLSHLILDIPSKTGVPLLYPLKKRFSLSIKKRS